MDPQPSSSTLKTLTPKRFPFLPTSLALLVLLLSASTIFLAYQNMELKKQISSIQVTPSIPTPSPTPIVAIDPVTGWKIYTNTKYNYSIEYPPDWKINLGVIEGSGDDAKLETMYQVSFTPSSVVGEPVTVWARVGTTFYKDINELSNQLGKLRPNSESVTIYSKNKTLLGGVDGLRYERSQLGVGKVITVSAIKNGYEYSIDLDPDTQAKDIKVFDQILSTFKFLKQNTSKLYTSEKKQGFSYPIFSFTYPESWSVQKTGTNAGDSGYQISRNDYKISIAQPPTSGIVCVFTDSKKPGEETPQEDLTKTPYTEIKSGMGLLRYYKANNPQWNGVSFSFCENSGGEFARPTTIGWMSYQVPQNYDKAILSQMDTILASVKIVR